MREAVVSCVLVLMNFFQLKAIEELKEKAKRGEQLEAAQLRKMEGEAEIRAELSALASSL